MSVSSCICCMFESSVHPVAVLNTAFCMTFSLLMLAEDARSDHLEYIIPIQETKLTPKVKTPKVYNFTIVRNDRLDKTGGGLITLIRDNITFTTTDIPSTIN